MLAKKLSKTVERWVALSAADGLIRKALRTRGVRGIDVTGGQVKMVKMP